MSSASSQHAQEFLLSQFGLYLHTGGLRLRAFIHFEVCLQGYWEGSSNTLRPTLR